MKWSVVYKKAIQDDGSLLFPERLTKDFLENARKTMGSYLFANQYLNEVIPDDERRFKKEWLRAYSSIPTNVHSFAFVDPAIGQKDHHDFTGIVVVDVDHKGNWYLKVANRYKITPTEIVNKLFDLTNHYHLKGIGLEAVAYQEALLYMLDEEMKKRRVILPVKGIKRTAASKKTRILSLVPRFEWGRIFIGPGLKEFEDEYLMFPRASHDDLLDSLSSLEEIVYYPQEKENTIERPNSPTDPNYERWYIQQIQAGKNIYREEDSGEEDF